MAGGQWRMDLDETTTLRLFLLALTVVAAIGLLPAMFYVFRIHHRHGGPDEEPPRHG
jgi:hypothetical protein